MVDKHDFIMFTDSVGQELRRETVEMTHLCFWMSELQLGCLRQWGRAGGDLNNWWLETPGGFFTHKSVIVCFPCTGSIFKMVLSWGTSNAGLSWDCQLGKIHVAFRGVGFLRQHGHLRVVVLLTWQFGAVRTGVPGAQGRCFVAFYDLVSDITQHTSLVLYWLK